MRRIQTKVNEINQTFEVKLNSNTSFKTKLQKDNKIIPVKNENSKSSFDMGVDNKDNSIYTKTDINNTPEEDTWYDEIIYYDGGGVEGYGD